MELKYYLLLYVVYTWLQCELYDMLLKAVSAAENFEHRVTNIPHQCVSGICCFSANFVFCY